MILDFINNVTNINYNINFAKLFGVYSAVYLNVLINCYFSMKDENDYIKLSRDDIYNLSAIEEDKQLEVEQNLVEYNLIEVSKLRNSSSKNYYKLNLELLNKLFISDSKEIQKELDKSSKIFKQATKPPAKVSKRAAIILNLKNNVKTDDSISKEALQDWVDAIYQKSGYLSKQAVEYMEDQLLLYSNKKITVFRELCKLAARVVYKDPKWVITKYEEEKNTNSTLHLNNINQEDIDSNLEGLKNYKGETF